EVKQLTWSEVVLPGAGGETRGPPRPGTLQARFRGPLRRPEGRNDRAMYQSFGEAGAEGRRKSVPGKQGGNRPEGFPRRHISGVFRPLGVPVEEAVVIPVARGPFHTGLPDFPPPPP